jgi:hypothetical protein
MNRRLFGTLGVVAALVGPLAGCKNDPLSDLDGTPAAVVLNFSYLQLAVGASASVTASVVDGRFTALEVPITFTACSADVSVTADTSYHPVPATSARANVRAISANPSCVRVAGGGLQDTITVAVLPQAFNGTASSATPMVGQLFSLYGSSLLGFNVSSANVDFGGGVVGDIVRRVGDTLTVRVPQPDATPTAPLSVQGVAVKYVPGLTVTLPTASNFTVTSPFGDRTTPGVAQITMPASGAADLVFWDGFPSGANGTSTFVDYYYQFTLAATDTLTFTLDWGGAADLDMINFRTNFTVIGGGAAATGANPETYSVIFPAGTYYLLVESFDDHADPAHLFRMTVHNP